jgi:hypothetical protein
LFSLDLLLVRWSVSGKWKILHKYILNNIEKNKVLLLLWLLQGKAQDFVRVRVQLQHKNEAQTGQ